MDCILSESEVNARLLIDFNLDQKSVGFEA